jgi:hypothetical protein
MLWRTRSGARGVWEATRQALGDAEPALDLGQHQNTGVGGQPSAIEGDAHRLAANRRRQGGALVSFHRTLRGGPG